MNFGTWEAIARRQAWYVLVLEQRLGEWSKERVDTSTDLETMRYVLALARRVDRHEQLMMRHLSKGVAPAPASQPPGWEAALKAVTDACKGETPQLCPGVTADTAVACLQSNYDKLTPNCKNAVAQLAKSALTLTK